MPREQINTNNSDQKKENKKQKRRKRKNIVYKRLHVKARFDMISID